MLNPLLTRQSLGLPFLKWPGGKRLLVKEILPFLEGGSGNYFEPFLGGGAVFFAHAQTPAYLSDTNEELINCYVQVRDHTDELLETLSGLQNSEEDYYLIRSSNESDAVKRAARFIYLTTLSFNGIYRLNLQGVFNVPYGYRTERLPYDADKIRSASSALAGVTLTAGDFESCSDQAKDGDTIYFDPPYTVAHGNNGFVKYNDKIFSWADQIRLHDKAAELAERGCRVVVSNANHTSLLTLYQDFQVEVVSRSSVIAASGNSRGSVTECIFFNEL